MGCGLFDGSIAKHLQNLMCLYDFYNTNQIKLLALASVFATCTVLSWLGKFLFEGNSCMQPAINIGPGVL